MCFFQEIGIEIYFKIEDRLLPKKTWGATHRTQQRLRNKLSVCAAIVFTRRFIFCASNWGSISISYVFPPYSVVSRPRIFNAMFLGVFNAGNGRERFFPLLPFTNTFKFYTVAVRFIDFICHVSQEKYVFHCVTHMWDPVHITPGPRD